MHGKPVNDTKEKDKLGQRRYSLPQSEKTDTGNLDDLETDTGNITLCLALSSETRDEDFVVVVEEVSGNEWTIDMSIGVGGRLNSEGVRQGTSTHKQPSLGTKAVTFLAFLINCTLTHFLMAELGCLASTPTFSSTIPLAWDEPPVGEDLKAVPRARFL